jgi:hypothetical protein
MDPERYASISTFLIRSGSSTLITAPPNTEWSLLFAHRCALPGISFRRRTTLSAMVMSHDGKLTDRYELLAFAPDQRNPLMPSLDLDSSSAVVCSVEGDPAIIRLFFASRSRAKLIVSRYGSDASLELPQVLFSQLPQFPENHLRAIFSLLHDSLPGPFFLNPSMSKFDPNLILSVVTALGRVNPGDLVTQLVELIGSVDTDLSGGKPITNGFALVFVTFLNNFTDFTKFIIAVCLNKANFAAFQSLILFMDNRSFAESVLQRPLPRVPVHCAEPLFVLFAYVAEHRPRVHYHLLNLFATISPIEELQIVFAGVRIVGLAEAEPERPLLEPAVTASLELGEEVVVRPLAIGGAFVCSSGQPRPKKLTRATGESVSFPSSVRGRRFGRCHQINSVDVKGTVVFRPGAPRKGDVWLSAGSVALMIIVLLTVLRYFTFVR